VLLQDALEQLLLQRVQVAIRDRTHGHHAAAARQHGDLAKVVAVLEVDAVPQLLRELDDAHHATVDEEHLVRPIAPCMRTR